MLLKIKRRKRAAGKIVADAAILHGRPVAHRARGKDARRPGQGQQLLESLHAVKDAGAGCANNRRFMRADHQNVTRRFHGRIEGEVVARQAGLRRIRVVSQKRDAIRRLCAGGLGGGLVGGRRNAF